MKLNWSRRELEALGEPLGDCVTTPKLGGGWICGGGGKGGGGGGPQQVTSTSTTSNIPEYARPYVENMLQSTQKQIYNEDMSGFRPYQPYSTNPSNYFAPFSPLQQSAQQGAYNLTTPGEFNAGSALTGVGGLGALGTAGQMANAGDQYQQQATSMYGPGGVGAYMNPYVAQSLAPQLQQLNQQFGIKGAQEQAAATQAGAFGGSRNALMQGLNQQNQQMAAQQAIAQGYDKAFQQAQQAQQFGANLGLQGQQGALQGYGQAINAGQGLGQLGSQRLAAQQGILNTQSTMGAQQQQLEQNKINQSIQDYATAQQYPFMQLGMMNAMLRGLPMQNMSTQQYQATPSYLTQGLGAVGTLAGAYKAFGQKEGGIVNMKEGGTVPSYAGPEGSVVDSVRAKLEELASQPGGVEKVKQIAQTSPSNEVRKMAAVVVAEHTMQDQAERQVTPPQAQAMSEGIAALPAPSMDSMAGGGIIAFAGPDGSEVEDPDLEYLNLAEKQRNMALQRAGIMNPANSKMKEYLAKQVGALPGLKESEKGLMMMDYFSNLGTQTGPLSYAALKAAKETTPTFRKGLESIKKAEADVMKGQSDLENADRLEALGLHKDASALRKDAEANKRALDIAKINAEANLKAAGINASRSTDLDRTTDSVYARMTAPKEQGGLGLPANAATKAAARKEAIETTGLALLKVGATENAALATAISKDPQIGEKGTLTSQLKLLQLKKNPTDTEKTKIDDLEDQIAGRRAQLENQIKRSTAKPPAPETPVPAPAPNANAAPVTPVTNKDGTITIPSGPRKGTYEPQADGTFKKIG
jgi:hypothetical protein